MLDVKVLRANFENIRAKLETKNERMDDLDLFLKVDHEHRELIQKTESLKSKRNAVSKEVAQKKREKIDASREIEEMRQVGDDIKELDNQLKEVSSRMNHILLSLPNIPHASVPIGSDEEDNKPVRYFSEAREDTENLKSHWELGKELGILDFEKAGQVTGSRFVFYKGNGARLERALINFMLDLHTGKHGYVEMLPPVIVNTKSLTATGQLPKFSEDVFSLKDTDYYLIPTAEVPVTNYHSEEIIKSEDLPKYYAAYSSCFRSEAGSHGRDTRGLIRQHQFNKVELVKFVHPEDSYEELEKLVLDVEKVLQLLELPYRVMLMCTGDLGFTAAKKYDIEVWMPSNNSYREISSCSNFEDFQARRASIRFREDSKEKPRHVHTLNGSGLALGRTVAAIIENNQQSDGSILIPEALREYMGGEKFIK